ncbi:MAG: aminoacyl-tRNA hydrolase [Deltaproteobacteria bacterium]|nr:aminoacyl-tRNA hydrolase [Deltaproteobacteria bacterium]
MSTDAVIPDLILGLGNPGPRYEGTRHNLGFTVVSELARRHGLTAAKSGFQSKWERGRVAGRPVILARPQTYMNLSGQAAQALLAYFRLTPDRLLVVHDDLDLPLGRLKIAHRGGAGGHKGIASLMSLLGTSEFSRLKLGIGRPRYDEPIEQYVLNGFYADQREVVDRLVHTAADCLEVILQEGYPAAMQQFHRSNTMEEVKG